MSVPFFTQTATFSRCAPRIHALLDEAIASGQFVDGPLVKRLETALQRRTGAQHAIAVGSGTDALLLALQAAGIGAGDSVILPVYTFIASATTVVHAGGRPVFVDIDPDTYAIDVDAAAETLARQDCAGIMPVHLFQHMADMDAICALAERADLIVVEDSAEGIDMRQQGRHAGRFGRAGVLSFFPTKTLGAMGDAGAVLTDDDDVAAEVRMRRSHGQSPDAPPYTWVLSGLNSRMDDVQASILLVGLEELDERISRRRELATLYDKALEDLAEWVLTPRPNPANVSSPVYVYLIEVPRRDELVAHLEHRQIGTEVYYPLPLHLQPCFAPLGYRTGDFPVAERAAARALALPLYPDLSNADVEEVCAAISDFYHRPSIRKVVHAR
jgi:UDP-2-acetamido-2-deoxy-ribo-hexuluronate aminotransferase